MRILFDCDGVLGQYEIEDALGLSPDVIGELVPGFVARPGRRWSNQSQGSRHCAAALTEGER